MSTVHELRQILSQLIEAWPDDQNHPTVEQARAHLGLQSVSHGSVGENSYRLVKMDMPAYEDHRDAAWYSI